MSDELTAKLAGLRDLAVKLKWTEKRLKEQEEALRKRYANSSGGKPAISGAMSRPGPVGGRPGGGGHLGGAGTRPQNRPGIDPEYVMAPYRFVDIAHAVLAPPPEVANRLKKDGAAGLLDTPLQHGLSGRLEISWEAETPLLIGAKGAGNTDDAPLKLGNDYWIPGASIRGMIRSVADICGFGRLSQLNKHQIFPLRDFKHPVYSDKEGTSGGAAVSRPDQLRAGWLFREGTGDQATYSIQNSDFAAVKIDDLLIYGRIPRGFTKETWLRSSLVDKYAAVNMLTKARGNARQQPPDFSITSLFRPNGRDNVNRACVTPATTGGSNGYLILSDKVPTGQEKERPGSKTRPKQVEYVFLTAPDRDKATKISSMAFDRFEQMHTVQARKGREPAGTWKLLKPLLDRGPIPVFYVGKLEQSQDRTFAFGLTRTFKIPHLYGIQDKLAKLSQHTLKRDKDGYYGPDMVEALFGYVHELPEYSGLAGHAEANPGDALKARLAFSGARIPVAVETETIHTVMSAPRASFAPFYLKGEIKDWSDAAAELAGRKRYLPRSPTADTAAALNVIRQRLRRQIDASNRNETLQSHLRFLHGGTRERPAPLRFTSWIDLHNLAPEEFGLLLFALTHGGGEKRYRHMIGRGKPFGAGQLRLVSLALRVDWKSGAADDALARTATPGEISDATREGWLAEGQSWSMAPFLAAYARHAMGAQDHSEKALAELLAQPTIGEFLATADPANGIALNGPDAPPRASHKTPPPFSDNYLRLSYHIPDERTGETRRDNPYVSLRRATMPQADDHRPNDQPLRLLPGTKAP